MSQSRIPGDNLYNSSFKPKYQPGYQLHDNEILDILSCLEIPYDARVVTSLQYPKGVNDKGQTIYYSPKEYYGPHIFNAAIDGYINQLVNSGQAVPDDFYIYQVVNPKSYHWVCMTTRIQRNASGDFEIDANCEDSMSSASITARLRDQLKDAFENTTIQGSKVAKATIEVQVKGIQNDGWSCGYWSIQALLANYLKNTDHSPNAIHQEVLDCKTGVDLRNNLLEKLFSYKKSSMQKEIEAIKAKVESDEFNQLSSKEQDNLISQLLSINKKINQVKILSQKIYQKEVDFSAQIKSCGAVIKHACENGGYQLYDALLTGRIPLFLVDAMTYTGLIDLFEVVEDKARQVVGPIGLKERNDQSERQGSVVLYINQDKSELTITFANEKKRHIFAARVPKSEFSARGNAEDSISTLDDRNSSKALCCPLYKPKGKSIYGINLGNKATVNNFLAALNLHKTQVAKYKNGQTKYVVCAGDDLPLFKYYSGKINNTEKSQENTLYLHENSPLAFGNSYIKLFNNHISYGAIGMTNLKNLKTKLAELKNQYAVKSPLDKPALSGEKEDGSIFNTIKNLLFSSSEDSVESNKKDNMKPKK